MNGEKYRLEYKTNKTSWKEVTVVFSSSVCFSSFESCDNGRLALFLVVKCIVMSVTIPKV